MKLQDFKKTFAPTETPQNNQNNEEFKTEEKAFYQDPTKNQIMKDKHLLDNLVKDQAPKENSISLIDFERITIDFNSLLGKGGSAIVYKGKWNGIDVAIKEINNFDINNQNEVYYG